ncbi:hypothetical protein QBC34DRAFT_267223, partial [Podospora aff. communis PSN243]
CGDSTFIIETSDGSPFVSDCQQLSRNLFVTMDPRKWRYFAMHRTCAIGMRRFDLKAIVIGTDDVKDIIRDLIKLNPRKDRVGGKGVMRCEPYRRELEWSVF